MKALLGLIMISLVLSPAFAIGETQIHSFTNFKEKVILFFTFDNDKKAELMIEFANKRINEISRNSDSEITTQLLTEYQDYLDRASKISDNKEVKDRINSERSKSIAVLEKVYENVPDRSKYKLEKIFNDSIVELRKDNISPKLTQEESQRIENIIKKRDLPRIEIGSIGKEEVTPNEDMVCIQVIQPARSKVTGEIREFPTPCDVPEGWEKISGFDEVGNDILDEKIIEKGSGIIEIPIKNVNQAGKILK